MRLALLLLVAGLAGCPSRVPRSKDPLQNWTGQAMRAEKARLGFVRSEEMWTQAVVIWRREGAAAVRAEIGIAPPGAVAWLQPVECPETGCPTTATPRLLAFSDASFEATIRDLAGAPLLARQDLVDWDLPQVPLTQFSAHLADLDVRRAQLVEQLTDARATHVYDERTFVRLLDHDGEVVGVAFITPTTPPQIVWPKPPEPTLPPAPEDPSS